MPAAETYIPFYLSGQGRIGRLEIEIRPDLGPGLHPGACMGRPAFPAPEEAGRLGFWQTTRRAYHVAMAYYHLCAGMSLEWCVRPCEGGRFAGFTGDSGGAAFLLALMKAGTGDFNRRALGHHGELEAAVAAVRLEWVLATATIGVNGDFGPVDPPALEQKLRALFDGRGVSRARLAVIAANQLQIGGVNIGPGKIFEFKGNLPGALTIVRAASAVECYETLFSLQSRQVWR